MGALIRKGALIGRRALNRIITVIRFEASNKAPVVVNTDSVGLRKRQNLQFCVKVFSTDTEFHDLICREHKLGVLYCVLVKTDF